MDIWCYKFGVIKSNDAMTIVYKSPVEHVHKIFQGIYLYWNFWIIQFSFQSLPLGILETLCSTLGIY